MTDGLSPSCHVHIAAAGSVPVGLSAFGKTLAWTLAVVVVASDARLTQVVEPRPYYISHDVRVVVADSPVSEGIPREALCLPDHTFGVALMVGCMLEYHIVVAHDVKHLGMRVIDFPIAVPCTERLGDGSRLVPLEDGLLHKSCRCDDADFLALDHLVADAPADDAGVVAVAFHHCPQVFLVA